MCTICNINNKKLLNDIEEFLEKNDGILTNDDKGYLADTYGEQFTSLKLSQDQLKIHWNFHQSIKREAIASIDLSIDTPKSLAKDIDKDEGTVLNELLNTQAATFNCLTKKINRSIEEHGGDLTTMIINPNTAQFYSDLAASIRNTVKELRELNVSINGAKDGAMEGLKALAKALTPEKDEQRKDLTTDEFD